MNLCLHVCVCIYGYVVCINLCVYIYVLDRNIKERKTTLFC